MVVAILDIVERVEEVAIIVFVVVVIGSVVACCVV